MGIRPTDLGQDFVASGRRLITQISSEPLLKKAAEKKVDCNIEFWDPTVGPQEPPSECL